MRSANDENQGLELALASGRRIAVTAGAEAGTELIEIRSPGGELEVSIVMTPEGPRLKLRALDIELDASRSLRMRCRDLAIEVENDASLVAGQVSMRANDDLDFKGERILLNSDAQPLPATWDDFQLRTGRGPRT